MNNNKKKRLDDPVDDKREKRTERELCVIYALAFYEILELLPKLLPSSPTLLFLPKACPHQFGMGYN